MNMHFGPVANDYWKGSFWFMSESYSWIASVRGIPLWMQLIMDIVVHMSVSVSIYVCFSAHAQPFSFSSKYFLHKRQCILHLDKHWTFKVSSMIDNRLLDNMTNIWTQINCITMDRINLLGWQQTRFESWSQPCPNTKGRSTCSDALQWTQTWGLIDDIFSPDSATINTWRCPKMQLCQAKIRVFALLRSKNFPKTPPNIFKFWVFWKSNFHKIFGITGQVPFFAIFSTSVPWRWFFFSFHHLQLARRARRLPDVPCPTFRARRARRLPDVCPTSARRLPDVCPTFACYPKNPRGWHSLFFAKFGHLQEMEVFFFEKKPTSQKDVKISSSKHQKNEERQKQGLAWKLALSDTPPKLLYGSPVP